MRRYSNTDAPEVYCDINNIGAPAVFDYFSKRGFSALGSCAKKCTNTVTVGPFMFSLHINRILQICKTEKRNVQQYAGAWSVWIILYQQQTRLLRFAINIPPCSNTYFRLKYNLDKSTMHPKFNLTRVRTHDL